MPELPEVEYSRYLLQAHFKNHTISAVDTIEDNIVFQGQDQNVLRNQLAGQRIIEAKRHGKYFWLHFDNDGLLLMHFGMTGLIEIQGLAREEYKTEAKHASESWPPRFWKMVVKTAEGGVFAFCDCRRLGFVKYYDREAFKQENPLGKLGFDPILSMPPFDDEFVRRVKSRAIALKSLLLEQSFAAGVGNWMADDIMLDAALHPEARCNKMTADQCQRLHKSIKYISETAVKAKIEGIRYPSEWLFHYRWPTDRKSKDSIISGHRISFTTTGGRTTAFIPTIQRGTSDLKPKDETEYDSPKPKRSLKRNRTDKTFSED